MGEIIKREKEFSCPECPNRQFYIIFKNSKVRIRCKKCNKVLDVKVSECWEVKNRGYKE